MDSHDQDRTQVNTLHGFPSTDDDTEWTQPATSIAIPTNHSGPRRVRNSARSPAYSFNKRIKPLPYNPITANRMRNNLHSDNRGSIPAHIGSQTSPHKRRKLSDQTFQNTQSHSGRRGRKAKQTGPAKQALQVKALQQQEPITVSDNDEDVGVPLSRNEVVDLCEDHSVASDDLNIRSASESEQPMPRCNVSTREPAQTVIESDPIEEYDEVSSGQGKVKAMVAEYERNANKPDAGQSSRITDLRTMVGKKQPPRSKGGASLKLQQIPLKATNKPLIISSTSQKGGINTLAPISDLFSSKWIPEKGVQYFLSWSPNSKDKLEIIGRADGKTKESYPVFYDRLKAVTIQKREGPPGSRKLILEKQGKPGELTREIIGLELSTTGSKDSENEYEKIFEHIKSGLKGTRLESVDVSGARASWERFSHIAAYGREGIAEAASISTAQQPQSKPVKRQRSPSQVDDSEGDPPSPSEILASVRPVKPVDQSPGKPIPQPRSTRSTTNTETSTGTRRSARQQAAASRQDNAAATLPNADEVVLSYPPGVGAVNITVADLERLKPGEFLNDNLIEFGLKLWLKDLESSNPELASQVHVFSSFFYKKLNIKDFDEGYQSVRKWTSKFDLFKKKYLIVPINEHLHWYLAIVHMPEFTLQPPLPPPPTKSKQQTRKSTRNVAAEAKTGSSTPVAILDENIDADAEVATPSSPGFKARSRESTPVEVEQLLMKSQALSIEENSPKPDILEVTDVDMDEAPSISAALKESGRDFLIPDTDSEDQASTTAEPPTQRRDGLDLRWPNTSSPIPVDKPLPEEQEEEQMCDEQIIAEELAPSSIPPRFFYGKKGHRDKIQTQPIVAENMEVDSESHLSHDSGTVAGTEVPAPTEESNDDIKTHIFTLDSLGSRHPQAITVLTKYLKAEAKDKHGNENPREPKGMSLAVPLQTNYCDCGVYLLDFARLFLNDPVGYYTKSKMTHLKAQERRLFWTITPEQRQDLLGRILSLSEEWKKEREEKKQLENHRDRVTAVEDSSDSEIEFLNHDGPTTPKPGKGKGKETKANRLR